MDGIRKVIIDLPFMNTWKRDIQDNSAMVCYKQGEEMRNSINVFLLILPRTAVREIRMCHGIK